MKQYLDKLLKLAVERKATDIHLCVGIKPLLRINTVLHELEEYSVIDNYITQGIANEILDDIRIKKFMTQKTVDYSYSKSELGRFRMNFYIQRGTPAIAIRSLPMIIPSVDELGLPDVVKQFVMKSKGLILVTGMTGSGKSTTLASLIQYINHQKSVHITTIEDPIEFLHKHNKSLVTQKEIGNDANDYMSALNATLREDPDVIMLGEMRDKDTITNALTGAETGHLLLSTLHTNSAVKSIDRILDTFSSDSQSQVRSQLATSLEGVISQQLIPGKDGDRLVLACEVLNITPAVRNLIREGKVYQIPNLLQNTPEEGMISMERSLANLVKAGSISYEEAKIRVASPALLDRYIK
ncbi:MAG: PilT/PilU family type 4a pilus ATPase [Bacillota bacterium]|nr:PilT/PilU family type 4a pilus ATPase [Bacillota bacterium]